jgi:hypothetical protein
MTPATNSPMQRGTSQCLLLNRSMQPIPWDYAQAQTQRPAIDWRDHRDLRLPEGSRGRIAPKHGLRAESLEELGLLDAQCQEDWMPPRRSVENGQCKLAA